jgi:hypothetical protein
MGEQQRLYGAAAVAAGAGRRYNLKGESVIESWAEVIERGEVYPIVKTKISLR